MGMYIKDYERGILMESKSDPKLPYIDLSTMIHRQRQVRAMYYGACLYVFYSLRSDLFFNSFYLKESGIPKRVCKLKDIPGLNDVMYTIGTVKMMCCETENSSAEGESVTDSGRGSQATDNVNGCFVLWQMVPRMWSLELVLSSGNKVMAVMETILSSFALEMLVPGHAVGKVMGRGRSKVDNIRKVNIRASIEISDTKIATHSLTFLMYRSLLARRALKKLEMDEEYQGSVMASGEDFSVEPIESRRPFRALLDVEQTILCL
ncbi:histone acetyltransferase GCN5 isoform X2 [Tanacetum coccineum]